jgi:hypothetical protein
MPKSKVDNSAFLLGGILAVFGLYELLIDLKFGNGFLLLGLGVVFMASSSKQFRDNFINFCMSAFEKITEFLFHSKD